MSGLTSKDPFTDWIQDGPSVAPARLLRSVLDAVPTVQQVAADRPPGLRHRRWRVAHVAGLVLRPAAFVLIASILVSALLLQASPGPADHPVASASPSATPTTSIHHSSTEASAFALPLSVALPAGWEVQYQSSRRLAIVHTGTPRLNGEPWWGPEVLLVDGGLVHDPQDRSFTLSADLGTDRYVPWPDDLAVYLASLPRTTIVSGPEPITFGDVVGSRVIVDTAPMPPIFWLEDDLWVGPSLGWTRNYRHLFVTLMIGGRAVLLQYEDPPDVFDERLPQVISVLETIGSD